MRIVVASGKGGTGKTTFAVNLAYVLADRGDSVRLLDCDVEEPNDHLFVRPDFSEERDVSVLKPVWDEQNCDGCGVCAKACNYNAIAVVKEKVLIFNELCHGCGVCSHVCPRYALREQKMSIGLVRVAPDHKPFFFADGMLNVAEALAPAVVEAVKTQAAPDSINILDASPGTACPVVKALDGADVAVLLTEPTPFGLNDLKLAAALTLTMGIPTGIVINRSDGKDEIISRYCEATGIPLIGRIPFKRTYAETYSSGGILVERHRELSDILMGIYGEICALRGRRLPPVPPIEEFAVGAGESAPFVSGQAAEYREITVISGKGGTGKTTVTASFAVLSGTAALADTDVDAADLHLLLTPRVREIHPFVGGRGAVIDTEKCAGCGKCADVCHFEALRFDGPANDVVGKTWRVDQWSCEGCDLCALVCPTKAIRTEETVTGNWYVSRTECGPMAHARLGVGGENSGRLVTQVRKRAAEIAGELHLERIIGDGPPGTGCPVIASVSGADLALIVTEPTISGVHDLKRVLDLAEHFRVPSLIIINKCDLNLEEAERIKEIAGRCHCRVIGRIPFDKAVNDALTAGKTVVQYGESPAAEAIKEAWKEVLAILT